MYNDKKEKLKPATNRHKQSVLTNKAWKQAIIDATPPPPLRKIQPSILNDLIWDKHGTNYKMIYEQLMRTFSRRVDLNKPYLPFKLFSLYNDGVWQFAALTGQTAVLQALTRGKERLESKRQLSPLQYAALSGQKETIDKLISAEKEKNNLIGVINIAAKVNRTEIIISIMKKKKELQENWHNEIFPKILESNKDKSSVDYWLMILKLASQYNASIPDQIFSLAPPQLIRVIGHPTSSLDHYLRAYCLQFEITSSRAYPGEFNITTSSDTTKKQVPFLYRQIISEKKSPYYTRAKKHLTSFFPTQYLKDFKNSESKNNRTPPYYLSDQTALYHYAIALKKQSLLQYLITTYPHNFRFHFGKNDLNKLSKHPWLESQLEELIQRPIQAQNESWLTKLTLLFNSKTPDNKIHPRDLDSLRFSIACSAFENSDFKKTEFYLNQIRSLAHLNLQEKIKFGHMIFDLKKHEAVWEKFASTSNPSDAKELDLACFSIAQSAHKNENFTKAKFYLNQIRSPNNLNSQQNIEVANMAFELGFHFTSKRKALLGRSVAHFVPVYDELLKKNAKMENNPDAKQFNLDTNPIFHIKNEIFNKNDQMRLFYNILCAYYAEHHSNQKTKTPISTLTTNGKVSVATFEAFLAWARGLQRPEPYPEQKTPAGHNSTLFVSPSTRTSTTPSLETPLITKLKPFQQ